MLLFQPNHGWHVRIFIHELDVVLTFYERARWPWPFVYCISIFLKRSLQKYRKLPKFKNSDIWGFSLLGK